MNENMITGIVFNLDKNKFESLKQSVDELKATKNAVQTIIVFRNDSSKHEVIDLSNSSDDAKERLINKIYNEARKDGAVEKNQVASYFQQDNDYRLANALLIAINHQKFESIDSIDSDAKKKVKRDVKKHGKKAVVTFGTLALAGALAACGISMSKNVKTKESENEVSIETQINNEILDEIPDSWLAYVQNSLNTQQKQLFVDNIAEWLTSVNAQEAWEKVTLTDQQMKEYGFTEAESLYGLTAEEAYSLALRFGNYSKEDYLAITGGNEIDTVRIMDDAHSVSNGALSRVISYYMFSDDCDLHIEKLINFNEAEQTKIAEFENLFREYHALDKDETKEKEAKEKMKEIKSALINYAHDVDYEQDNAKSYILRTFAPAAAAISEIHQYKDNIEVTLYDTKNQTEVSKEVQTALFDEIMMRTLVLGFNESEGIGAFDAESFLEEHNISKARYNLLNTDVGNSIADKSCGPQSQKLDEANKYIATMRSENYNAELAYAGGAKIDLSTGEVSIKQLNNVELPYDEATRGTYNPTEIMDLLDTNLMDNGIYPQNIDYFTKYIRSELAMEYKNTHGVTSGKPGDVIKTATTRETFTEEELSGDNIVAINQDGEVVPIEEAKEEARKKDAEESSDYDYDASTPEKEEEAKKKAEESDGAKERMALLAGVYAATYNHYAGQAVIETDFSYDESWATSSDEEIVYNYNLGKQDGLQWKLDEEEYNRRGGKPTYGGETEIDPEFRDAEEESTVLKDEGWIATPEKEENTPEKDKNDSEENGKVETLEDNGWIATPEKEENTPEKDINISGEGSMKDEGWIATPEKEESNPEKDDKTEDDTNQKPQKEDINFFEGMEDVEIDGDYIFEEGALSSKTETNNAIDNSLYSLDEVDNYIQQFDDLSDEEFMSILDSISAENEIENAKSR